MHKIIMKKQNLPVLRFKSLTLLFLLLWMIIMLSGCFATVPADGQVASDLSANSSFAVHFIDVGQADAALVLCDEQALMIDGGNSADSSLIVSYLKQLGINQIDYLICTHAHEDHVGGLSGALNYASVGQAFAPVEEYDNNSFHSFKKYLAQQGLEITVPQSGDQLTLGSAELTFLTPLSNYDEVNNTSLIVRIVYGETSFLFTGDAEYQEEKELLATDYALQSDVLKVGHHGSSSSTCYSFLRAVAPHYAVISVGKENDYGHPHDKTLSLLRDAGVKVYRTDQLGNIICISDGQNLNFMFEHSTTWANDAEASYIGNLKSHNFHLSTCTNLPAEHNRIYFDSYEEAVAGGYSPCGVCLSE